MGHLDNGKWVETDMLPIDRSGAFVRVVSTFRDRITADGSSGFKAEPGRYHLFVAPSCPWAHRTVIFRKLKRLETAISVSFHDQPKRQGWAFSSTVEGAPALNDAGILHLHAVYTAAKPDFTGRVTVPTLWDKKTRTIVNNESSEIIRMLNSEFQALGATAYNYYPTELHGEIDEINGFVYERINNGVYRCGFAKSQKAYEEAFYKLFDGLDQIERCLSTRRYLVGARQTEADWRLFVTLVRFDAVYYSHFKCNLRRIAEYPNLSNYLRDLYQTPGVAETVEIAKIKEGYYGSQPQVNPTGIVPIGPVIDFTTAHDRERLGRAA